MTDAMRSTPGSDTSRLVTAVAASALLVTGLYALAVSMRNHPLEG